MADKEKAAELKTQGNAATSAGEHEEAVRLYSDAIELDAGNHVLWSNRSAAHAKLAQYEAALADAEQAIKCNPGWAKAYSRKALALTYLKRHDEALLTYEEGLEIDPTNATLKEGLQEAKAHQANERGGAFPNPFSDPVMIPKLAANPKTKHLLEDPEFMAKLKMLQANPSMLSSFLQDQRIMQALGVMMGVDLQAGGGNDDRNATGTPPPASTSTSKPTPKAAPDEKMDVEVSPAEEQAVKEKELGNAAYKRKEFETAITHYEKALELNPTDMTYLLNMAGSGAPRQGQLEYRESMSTELSLALPDYPDNAVRLEQGQLEKAVELSLRAVEVGRESRTDYKLIAKALSRCALAYFRMKDYQQAKTYYEKSLSEHRNPDTRTKLSQVEKTMKEVAEKAYLDPVKAEEERERGNQLFKEGNYSEAVKAYTEAIRRSPTNPKAYSNRAACYTKLAAFDLGLKDCDECIRLDPTFIKGYIRKGMLLKGMQKFDRAMDAFQKAIELDENNSEAINGYRESMMSLDNDPDQVKKRALSDPEVQQILKDPSMRLILEQMQENPQAAREHLQNPDIATKIQKLVQSGLIAFR